MADVIWQDLDISSMPEAIIAKYDTNKDGRLDKEERAKMTPEDAAKLPPPPDRKKKQN